MNLYAVSSVLVQVTSRTLFLQTVTPGSRGGTMRSEQTIARTFQARFGSVVRSQRQSAGLSQEELAHRSGLHRTYVTDVERGARNPSLNSIKKLSDALRVSLSDLFSLVEGVERNDRAPDSGSSTSEPRETTA